MSEWKAKTLKEVRTSDGVVWRAQTTTAPDGRKFVGVRKFAVKKDGTELVTKDGLSLIVNDGKVPVETIRAIIDLLSGFTKPEKESASRFGLFNRTSGNPLRVLRQGVTKVRLFNSVEEARAYRATLAHPASWAIKRVETP